MTRSRGSAWGGTFAAALCLLLLCGCGKSDGLVPLPDFDAWGDAGVDSGFEKPPTASMAGDPRAELSEAHAKGEGLRIRRIIRGREYMRPDELRGEYWLYDDEVGVFDAAARVDGLAEPMVFDIYVFVDFEAVPFGYIEVDADPQAEPFPSVARASATTTPRTSASITFEPDEPTAFSLVIPPESLGKPAAHDVRVVLAARPSPTTERSVVWPFRTSFQAVINFGGTAFTKPQPTLEDALVSPPAHIAPLVGGTGVFVEPPVGLYDLANIDSEAFYTEAKLGQVFETTADSVRLAGWVQSSTDSSSEVFLTALVDNDPLDRPRGQATLPEPVTHYDTDSYPPYTARVGLDVEVDDQMKVIRLLRFENPFSRHGHAQTDISNAIFIRRVAQ